MEHLSDTIFALSSAPGRAGVAVWRISGAKAGAVFTALCLKELPTPRVAVRVDIHDPANADVIDDGIALWFPAPASFTGEDVIEFHLHGGVAVAAAITAVLAAQPGLRIADPGEFTRRAFENDKLDLTAAEGVADLVDAETAAQRRQARRQMAGELGRIYEDWRARLLGAIARFEAEIDFSDEDLPPGLHAEVARAIARMRVEVAAHLDDARRGEILRGGVSVAIVGPPNAGKSSLLNRLARRDAAIVSEIAGTTRDVIEVHLDLGGYPVVLADTAGLRAAGDAIEQEGVRRALARAEAADLKLVVLDGKMDSESAKLIDGDALVVQNKIDLGGPAVPGAIGVSAKTGAGLDALEAALGAEVARRFAPSEAPALTRERHRRALMDASAALARFGAASAPELAAEDLRLAARALGRITGRIDVEDVLDVIFAEFCIGK